MAADIFEYSKRVGYHFSLLDIGGGFPGTRDSQDLFRRVTGAINQGLEKHFSALPGLKIIAEPGGERGVVGRGEGEVVGRGGGGEGEVVGRGGGGGEGRFGICDRI